MATHNHSSELSSDQNKHAYLFINQLHSAQIWFCWLCSKAVVMLMEVLYAKWYNSIQGNWMQKIGGQLHEETLSFLYKGQAQENIELLKLDLMPIMNFRYKIHLLNCLHRCLIVLMFKHTRKKRKRKLDVHKQIP